MWGKKTSIFDIIQFLPELKSKLLHFSTVIPWSFFLLSIFVHSKICKNGWKLVNFPFKKFVTYFTKSSLRKELRLLKKIKRRQTACMKKGSIEMIYFSQTLWAINGNMDNNVSAKTTAKRQISSENNKYYVLDSI